MLLLPATVTAREARDTRRLLLQAMKAEPASAAVVVDASNLQRFDSSALAVLLDCRRAAEGSGQAFALRAAPPKLTVLARLYGVESLLPIDSASTSSRSMPSDGQAPRAP